jgi:ADP-heptose:LPS heptosyltransferase
MSWILVSPFSNGDIRDWQPQHFSRLISCLLDRWEGDVCVVGTRSQATRAANIVRFFPASRVHSHCGRAWSSVVELVRGATCVVGNNSGITHLSAWFGVPTVCVFAGSHRRAEWHPMASNALTISRSIGCAPCFLHRAADCSYGKACLDQIDPALVADVVLELINELRRERVDGIR